MQQQNDFEKAFKTISIIQLSSGLLAKKNTQRNPYTFNGSCFEAEAS